MKQISTVTLWALALLIPFQAAAEQGFQTPLKLPNGEPVVGVYFNGYKASPWKSDDAILKTDLENIQKLGANVIFSVHGPVEALTDDWKAYSREHNAAKAAKLTILPGLEFQCGMGLSNEVVAKKYGIAVPKAEDQNGKKVNSVVYSDEYKAGLVRYASDYLKHFLSSGAILKVMVDGRPRPVVALTFETGWFDASFDDQTTKDFWHSIYKSYVADRGSNIGELNFYWGTKYKDWSFINPKDAQVFDYGFELPDEKRLWRPMAYHAMFRADLVNKALTAVREQLLKEYPDLLIAAEIPYPLGSQERAAIEYRWRAACLPRTLAFADIILMRTTGDVSTEEENWMLKLIESGYSVILCHTMDKNYGYGKSLLPVFYSKVIPEQTALFANGLGFYSWNEMTSSNFCRSSEVTGKAQTITQYYKNIYSATGTKK